MQPITAIKCPHCGDMWEANDWAYKWDDAKCFRCQSIYKIPDNRVNMYRWVFDKVKEVKGEQT